MVTKDILHAYFEYNALTGHLINKPRRYIKSRVGKPAAYLNGRYYICKLDKQRILEHRLVWIFHHGPIPPNREVDHINHDALDNRIENLRLVFHKNNMRNVSRHRDNMTGVTGVCRSKQKGHWDARITVDGNELWLGTFPRKEHAVVARSTAEYILDFHEHHGLSLTEINSQK